jgi:hemolysin III
MMPKRADDSAESRSSVGDRLGQGLEQGRERLERIEDRFEQKLDTVRELIKPKLRGWLHAGTFPLSVLLGAILVILAPSEKARVSTAIFAVTASLLFGVSALYHRGQWGPRTAGVLKRIDHANIFLIIAGTYTPFSVLLLSPGPARTLLWIVWTGALLGVAFRVLWVGAPRWLYVPVYIALGWVAVAYLPQFWAGGSIAAFVLVLVGGGLYTVGAVVYGFRKPNPSPRWFGFHEVFHTLTVLAFLAHYVGVSIAAHSGVS